jgi:hypothetical protein
MASVVDHIIPRYADAEVTNEIGHSLVPPI